MKKYVPYLLGVIAIVLLIVLIFTTPFVTQKKLDERITLRQKDKIPYGTYAAYQLLPSLFPNATISTNKLSPLDWAFDTVRTTGQAMFIAARIFNPEVHELMRMIRFIESGNYVFIMANGLSSEAAEYLQATPSGIPFQDGEQDSLQVQLSSPPFKKEAPYLYPGKKWATHFSMKDPFRTKTVGVDEKGHPNFILLQAGRGKLFIHLAPLAFSNYFILHKNNVSYFAKAVSLVPDTVKDVVWNEYYLTSRKKNETEPNMLSVLWQYPAFKAALLTAIATLLIYVLIEMKRRRSAIPFIQKPKNDALDYVRTLGRLYYDQKDHLNLAQKATLVFLDFVRNRYHLFTNNIDADFIEALHLKSGYNKALLEQLISYVQFIQDNHAISEQQLAAYHQQLENFYQNT